MSRRPRQNPGELKAQWAKLPHDEPDICYFWGEGTQKADSHLLHDVLSGPRYRFSGYPPEPSFVKELETRGYDLTTLKFSIKKKGEASR